jgi:hypothetical protein
VVYDSAPCSPYLGCAIDMRRRLPRMQRA